jgi:Ran GTPase-activating protein (RanGAP) involved in mRNA processing and transport
MLPHEISQILVALGNIFASHEEKILTAIRNIFACREVIEEQQFHVQHQEDLEEAKESWKEFDEE